MKPILLTLTTLVIFVLANSATAANQPLEPLYTKSALRQPAPVIEAYVESYRGRGFQEITSVDATELRVAAIVPVTDNGQLRVTLPFFTDGDGERIANGAATDVRGNGGTFNFTTVSYEHAFDAAPQSATHWMAYAGLGVRTARLETSHRDYMNHHGRSAIVGARVQHRLDNSATLLADVGFHYYYDSDDLNPSRGGDSFRHLVASTALAWAQGPVSPAIELTYRGDFSDYNNLAIVPEIGFAFGLGEVVLGAPIGLTGDADDFGVTLGLRYRM